MIEVKLKKRRGQIDGFLCVVGDPRYQAGKALGLNGQVKALRPRQHIHEEI
jgi:hypothetical protein